MTTPRKPLRVLVVEDDVDAAEALTELLDVLGYTATAALDGERALDVAAALRPELVLCDLSLPGLDGFEVARALRTHPATARAHLVALSGHVGSEVDAQSRAAGFDALMPKPFDIERLGVLLDSVASPALALVGGASQRRR